MAGEITHETIKGTCSSPAAIVVYPAIAHDAPPTP